MLTVEDYCKIRIAHRDGMSIRQIARRFGHSRRKVRQVLEESEPHPYILQRDRPAPRLGPYKAVIEQILAQDQQAPRKQQHTAAKLYRRLRDEHRYAGGYDQVRRYVGKMCRARRETFIPLTHPSGGADKETLRGGPALDEVDLVITTYGLCQKYAWLQNVRWDLVILDEAQTIKNPGTQQTRAVKKLRARNRIIVTGTQIENRLSDVWSLFDFLNPGLLGTAEEFTGFSKKLNRDSSGYARLKTVVGPYILRRLKTDKTVISDLPEKIEMKTYAELAKKQVVLYEDLVKQLRQVLEEQPEGIRRKGLILASLTKFKRLCNHPDQYLGQGGFAELDSGKSQRLRPICGTIFEKREKMLVFTQFREMTGPCGTTPSTSPWRSATRWRISTASISPTNRWPS